MLNSIALKHGNEKSFSSVEDWRVFKVGRALVEKEKSVTQTEFFEPKEMKMPAFPFYVEEKTFLAS